MATDADITLDVSGFPSEIPCGGSHINYLDKIIVKRYDILLSLGTDYVLDFEFTQDGETVDEINWCKTSDSVTIKVIAKVKPESGPATIISGLDIPSEGPSSLTSELELPYGGPTSVTSVTEPVSGPSSLTSELELPYGGPSSLAADLLVPASGPTGLTAEDPTPVSGPTGLTAIEETAPVSGPTGLTAIEDTSICVSGSSQDGTWAETGTYNGKKYWYTSASGGRWIYWDSGNSYWAFSTSLGGLAGDNDNGGTHPWSGTWNTITVSQWEC